MIKTIAELKAFLKPGVKFRITAAPYMHDGDPPKEREVIMVDGNQIICKDPSPELAEATWNRNFIALPDKGEEAAFEPQAFYIVRRVNEGGKRELSAFRCEYVEPIPA